MTSPGDTASAGKLTEMAALAIHWAKPATASPDPRIWFGNISPSITHMIGPQLMLKKIT